MFQVYIAAGKTFQLSDRVDSFEEQMRAVTIDTPRDDVSKLERSVTQMVEQVEETEKKVRYWL